MGAGLKNVEMPVWSLIVSRHQVRGTSVAASLFCETPDTFASRPQSMCRQGGRTTMPLNADVLQFHRTNSIHSIRCGTVSRRLATPG